MADNAPAQIQLDPNMIQMAAILLSGNTPLHLGTDLSINLARVIQYGSFEMYEMQKVKEGTKTVEKQVSTGKFEPGIILHGQAEPLILTEEQNEIFRGVWNDYATLANFLHTAVRSVAVPLNEAAATMAPPPAEAPIEETGGQPS